MDFPSSSAPRLIPYTGLSRSTGQASTDAAVITPARDALVPEAPSQPTQPRDSSPAAPAPPSHHAFRALHRSRQIARRWRLGITERFRPMPPVSDLRLHFGDRCMQLQEGSITDARVAAVVTAANAGLRGGAGVDAAVHTAAGPDLLDACRKIGGCPTGGAVVTPAFDLESNGVERIIHAVGPIWYGGDRDEETLLRDAYRTALQLADAEGCKSMAFPAISCGVYGYPLQEAAHIALSTVAEHLQRAEGAVHEVTFVLFDKIVFNAFCATLANMRPMPEA